MSESLGIYLHVPFCKHACPYCDFFKIELRDRSARARLDFPAQLQREMALFLGEDLAPAHRPLDTVYFGGGTPSTLVPGAVGELIAMLRSSFAVPEREPEVTLEANPENLTPERSQKWRAAGINRLSIGVQSFRGEDLELLERLHEPQTIEAAMRHARAAGFENISLDLMFALPGQTLEQWEENLRRAIALEPEHLSFYGLTYHENTPFEQWLREERLQEVDEDAQAEMYLRGAEVAEEAGFEHYEISNFARPGYRSRHNQRYWRRADVLGLGPGAHSNLGRARWMNPEDLEAWAAALEQGRLPRKSIEEVSGRIAAGERLYTLLRRKEGLRRGDDPELFKACLAWAEEEDGAANKWFNVEGDCFALTRQGWLVSNAIVEHILGRLEE